MFAFIFLKWDYVYICQNLFPGTQRKKMPTMEKLNVKIKGLQYL